MSLPFILEIIVNLISIYLLLGLLASGMQGIIATLLQWRAKHLKQSIENLLAGGKSTREEINKSKRLVERIYYNCSGDSYITSEIFATTLIDTLNISLLIDGLIELRLDNFVRSIVDGIEDIAYECKTDISNDKNFERLKDRFIRIKSRFKKNKFSLMTTIELLSDSLDKYIKTYSTKNDESLNRFSLHLESFKQWTFGDKNETAIISGGLNPSLTEIIDTINIESKIHQEIKEMMFAKDRENYQKIAEVLNDLPISVKHSLGILARQAKTRVQETKNEINQLREEISIWFERSMERASGVYKRNAKGVAILIGFFIAFAINTDTLHIVSRLSSDEILRQVVIEHASRVRSSPATPSAVSSELEYLKEQTNQALEDISLPLSWNPSNLGQQFNCSPNLTSTTQNKENRQDWAALFDRCIPENKASATFFVPQKIAEMMIKRPWLALRMILGWFLSSIAIAMASSFCSELLGKMMNSRNSDRQLLLIRHNKPIYTQSASSLREFVSGSKTALAALIELLQIVGSSISQRVHRWFVEPYRRRQATARRQRAIVHRQLKTLAINFSQFLEGSSLDELEKNDLDDLAKVLPKITRQDRIKVYKDILKEKLEAENVNNVTSPEAFQPIRRSLGINDKQHDTVLMELGNENPNLLHLIPQQQRPRISPSLTLADVLKLPWRRERGNKMPVEQLLFLQVMRTKQAAEGYLFRNENEKAKFSYQSLIASLDRMKEGWDIINQRSIRNSYSFVYKRLVETYVNNNELEKAWFYAETSKNQYIVERIAKHDAPLPQKVRRELSKDIEDAKRKERRTLQAYTDELIRNINKKNPSKLNDKNEKYDQWYEAKKNLDDLYAEVAKIEPEFIAKTKVSPLSFIEVQALLPSDTAILEFFFTETQLLVILIFPKAESPVIAEDLRLELEQNRLAEIAKDWSSDITGKTAFNQKEGISAKIKELSDRIDQISDILKTRNLLKYISQDIKHLIIVPNNYLFLFPIHALWVVNKNQRLIDRFSVRYFPNLQVWKICENRQRSRSSLIGVENPTQDKDLIFAKAEVASICQRKQFVQSQVLKGQQASTAEILCSATHHHCFHFSGHAEYNFENPLSSYLMLSENSAENLTLSTILADMHMPQADLVTLSACCTGVVDAFQPTEEHLGLATGFLLAGAKAVIGSQWKVNSISTAFLLDEFYRQLDETDDKAVALQNAQNWLRRCTADQLRERAKTWDLSKLEPTEQFRLERVLKRLKGIPDENSYENRCENPYENPYYWAAFILTGC